jgi:hypothetical protein
MRDFLGRKLEFEPAMATRLMVTSTLVAALVGNCRVAHDNCDPVGYLLAGPASLISSENNTPGFVLGPGATVSFAVFVALLVPCQVSQSRRATVVSAVGVAVWICFAILHVLARSD